MGKVVFLANAYSPHVRQWINKNKSIGVDVLILTVDDGGPLGTPAGEFVSLGFFKNKYLKLLNYIIAGFYLRFSRKYKGFLHVHNASGYGLSAMLSGREYVLTTYGSEVYKCSNSSIIYRALINRILCKSRRIYASSDAMKTFIHEEFKNISNDHVVSFSLGVNDVFRGKLSKKNNVVTFFSNRRITPFYNTIQIVRAFKCFVENNAANAFRLLVLEGDYDQYYKGLVYDEVKSLGLESQVEFIKGFVSELELKKKYQESDFSISMPESDQLSSSILESMAMGVVPILNDLDAYNGIFSKGLAEPVYDKDIFSAMQRAYEKFKNDYYDNNKLSSYISSIDEEVGKNILLLYSF